MQGLFKGVLSPVFGKSPVNAILFASEEYAKVHLGNFNLSPDSVSFFAGCFGGLATSPIICPIEFLKIQKQANEKKTVGYFKLIK
jgi:hypothetical protein